MKNRTKYNLILLMLLFGTVISCVNNEGSDDLDILDPTEENTSSEEDGDIIEAEGSGDEQTNTTGCSKENSVYNEADGIVSIEFESAQFGDNWELKSEGNNYTGEGYMVWTGDQFLGNPGNGLATFKINITTPGTYRFEWRSSVTIGDLGTEHNDTWLRFADADDYYGEKDESRVYPSGTGKTPNPNGSSKDGWFKIYRSGNDLDFKWSTSTSDNDAHKIYVTFNSAKTYTMEVSARSSGHAIDKFVLFKDPWTLNEATSANNTMSSITCD
ncbi:hypothetical protein R3X28_07815 [Maribacter sp. TH_r10]|uniref:hypothetical protein n=1 Tax=Maribacter sp. TH_r10 TaxID=3082086 RepID=UPI002952EBAB|nr:hypothetical protein [Maribacter sp. TH_r10]MDV7138778.1 hypothetical protein [Maribacter sp. TH_r10]